MLENITIGEIVAALAIIVSCGSGIAYITKPLKEFTNKQRQIDEEIENIKSHQDNDNKRLATLEADSKMTLQVLNAILGHLQTGNNTGGMAEAKKALENYIINR